MAKNKIRAATIGGKKTLRREKFEVNGVEVEIRQFTVGQRSLVMRQATEIADDGTEHFNALMWNVWAVIASTFDPESGEPVFDAADFDEMLTHPSGSFIDQIARRVNNLNRVDLEELAKNSETPPSASSSSDSPKPSDNQSAG